MKKLLLAVLLLPSLAFADQWCLYNGTKANCEQTFPGIAFCDNKTIGDIGNAAYSICQDALYYEDQAFTLAGIAERLKAQRDECDVNYSSALKSLSNAVSSTVFNALKSDYNNLLLQHNSLVNDYNSLLGQFKASQATIVKLNKTIKKLKKK